MCVLLCALSQRKQNAPKRNARRAAFQNVQIEYNSHSAKIYIIRNLCTTRINGIRALLAVGMRSEHRKRVLGRGDWCRLQCVVHLCSCLLCSVHAWAHMRDWRYECNVGGWGCPFRVCTGVRERVDWGAFESQMRMRIQNRLPFYSFFASVSWTWVMHRRNFWGGGEYKVSVYAVCVQFVLRLIFIMYKHQV